jgi:hypothetical protein
MNGFGPFPMCYQVWMLPNFAPTRRPYYPPFAFYPQIPSPQVNNLMIQNMNPVQNKNLDE